MIEKNVEVVPLSFTAELVLAGVSYVVSSFDITYVTNQPSYAECHLAVGFRGDRSGRTGADVITFTRGTKASLVIDVESDTIDPNSGTVLLKEGRQVAFDGFIDDIGPSNLTKGNFNLVVKLVSRLAVLASGTLQTAKLVPSTFLDTTVPLPIFSPNDRRVAPNSAGFTVDQVGQDFWGALRAVFTDIANTDTNGGSNNRDALSQFIDVFGSGVNQPALDVINTITGSLTPGALSPGDLILSVTDYLNHLFTTDFLMESFLHRIVNLGQEFRFRLVERFSGIEVVPYSPFFKSTIAKSILPSTVYNANWANREPNNLLGIAVTIGSPNMLNNNASGQPYLIGTYKRPSEDTPLGSILTFPGPPWLCVRFSMNGQEVSAVDAETTRAIGNGWAKEIGLELAYRGRGVQVECPFRTDIGVLDPVRLVYPRLSGTNLGTAIYGSVQMVKLSADSVQKRGSTIIEIGYARSQTLQTAEFEDYQHPLWTEQYGGGRLDD